MQSWLYELSGRANALVEALEYLDGEDEADASASIAEIYGEEVPQAIADGIGYIKWQESEVSELAKEISRLQAMKKARENRLRRVRRGYAEFLNAIDRKKVETRFGNMTLSSSTETMVDDIGALPDVYKRTTIKVDADKTSIKQAIQSGSSVPGAHLETRHTIRIT